MSLTITAAQRDALYDQILDRLSGIGDIELAIEAESYEDAERLGREYCDELRLLLDDLGLGDGRSEPVELTAPPALLRRVLPRLRELADKYTSGLEPELIEAGQIVAETNSSRRRVRRCWRALTERRPPADSAGPVPP